MKRFYLEKLSEVEDKEKYCFEVTNRSAALEHLDAEVEMNTVRKTIRVNIQNLS
jgi:hypothetical protein